MPAILQFSPSESEVRKNYDTSSLRCLNSLLIKMAAISFDLEQQLDEIENDCYRNLKKEAHEEPNFKVDYFKEPTFESNEVDGASLVLKLDTSQRNLLVSLRSSNQEASQSRLPRILASSSVNEDCYKVSKKPAKLFLQQKRDGTSFSNLQQRKLLDSPIARQVAKLRNSLQTNTTRNYEKAVRVYQSESECFKPAVLYNEEQGLEQVTPRKKVSPRKTFDQERNSFTIRKKIDRLLKQKVELKIRRATPLKSNVQFFGHKSIKPQEIKTPRKDEVLNSDLFPVKELDEVEEKARKIRKARLEKVREIQKLQNLIEEEKMKREKVNFDSYDEDEEKKKKLKEIFEGKEEARIELKDRIKKLKTLMQEQGQKKDKINYSQLMSKDYSFDLKLASEKLDEIAEMKKNPEKFQPSPVKLYKRKTVFKGYNQDKVHLKDYYQNVLKKSALLSAPRQKISRNSVGYRKSYFQRQVNFSQDTINSNSEVLNKVEYSAIEKLKHARQQVSKQLTQRVEKGQDF